MRTRIVVPVAAVCAVGSFGAVALADGKPASNQGHHAAKAKAKESRALFAVLSGRNEIGPDGRRGAGDPDGRGSFTAIVDGNELCFGITVTNLDTPAAAHIHVGRRFQNGPIVVPLTAPASGDPGASSGCVTVDPALARKIFKHPRQYYANVHTAAFPGGAVRGQLHRRGS